METPLIPFLCALILVLSEGWGAGIWWIRAGDWELGLLGSVPASCTHPVTWAKRLISSSLGGWNHSEWSGVPGLSPTSRTSHSAQSCSPCSSSRSPSHGQLSQVQSWYRPCCSAVEGLGQEPSALLLAVALLSWLCRG